MRYKKTCVRDKRFQHNKTVKIYSNTSIHTLVKKIQGKIIKKRAGWIVASVYGEPFERGFAHGYLLKNEFKRVLKVLEFLLKEEIEVSMSKFMEASNRIMKPIVMKYYPELYDEMRGIAAGATAGGVSISTNLIIAWNSYISLHYYFTGKTVQRCSAFIATGNATKHGDIIMSHNTHTNFAMGQIHNIILYVTPIHGHSFVMQTTPGYVASATDWFLCSTGIIGCETTISRINYKPKFGDPYYCRIRQAMQYGETLDDYDRIMSNCNAGDYACSWLFGDIRTNEIMLFELGYNQKNVERTTNGLYYGMNSVMDKEFRDHETKDRDHNDVTTSVGSRNHRLQQLLHHDYYGKLDIENAKKIIADHYDMHLQRDVMNGRGICKHTELDPEHCSRSPHYPFGCTDAKVVDSEMVKSLIFMGRFGSACGRSFSIKKYVKENPHYKKWGAVITDMPGYGWIKIQD